MSKNYANILGHMCYAAYKLWNVCNYERLHYKEIASLTEYPDWYYQKKAHKDDLWYKQLPSQTAQEVCKRLDKSWKSFYALVKSGNIENPRPPRFKRDKIAITYIQNGFKLSDDTLQLSLSKQLKDYMAETYGIHETYLFLKNKHFKNMKSVKQVQIYPPKPNGECEVILIYEVDDVPLKEDNQKYLSIDLGLHNLMTCFDNATAKTFIVGRRYLSLCRKYDKQIARIQSQWDKCQSSKGVKYPRKSKHVLSLYKKKQNCINDTLHKLTHYLVNYCVENDIHTLVIGDIKNIRKDSNFGAKINQKLHGLPYEKIYELLTYKCAMVGINFIKQEESYSSQCSPNAEAVTKENACKNNRIRRGCYREGTCIYNADSVGAYNILRKYNKKVALTNTSVLSSPQILKVAV
jgi:putative transposase